jgi:peptidoglycan/LPS O-acetylase OafA/YrhL
LKNHSNQFVDFKYRPDVDGLRAIAVAMVVLYHYGFGFSGGFIGVDVFFVIYGFLITGIVLKSLEAREFSLTNFWVRRIRRILPASILTVALVFLFGYFLLLPRHFEELGESAIYQQLFVANFYFWRTGNYFDGASELKPLLHTWSLAVEEQFYIGYPFVLAWLYRFGRNVMFSVLFALTIGSFAVSVFAVPNYPMAAFFLLPTRAWEMLLFCLRRTLVVNYVLKFSDSQEGHAKCRSARF